MATRPSMVLPRTIALLVLLTTMAAPAAAQDAPAAMPGRSFWRDIGGDFTHLFSADNARVLGITSVAAVAAVPWDAKGEQVGTQVPAGTFGAGQLAGNFLVQLGAGALTWEVGRRLHHPQAAAVGRDLVRAQVVAGAPVLLLKITVRRERPDGSNKLSFPSGHAASAFAMASTLRRHFGAKAGIPAYLVGVYVATARVVAHKHYLSDVVVGAGLGIIGGRTVTVGLGRARLGVAVAPTPGGAAVLFTRRENAGGGM